MYTVVRNVDGKITVFDAIKSQSKAEFSADETGPQAIRASAATDEEIVTELRVRGVL